MTRPTTLIENWLPFDAIGVESLRERSASSALAPLYFLHVWLACALPTVYLFIRQRAWWLWPLGQNGEETTEPRWTWRVARLFGLRRPSDQLEIHPWKTSLPSAP